MWNVEYTDEFEKWWSELSSNEQVDLAASIRLLEAIGPTLGRPHADTVRHSRHPNMKELRTQSSGKPLRTFFAFDPRRSAILLVGGDKTGDSQFYQNMVPAADQLYDQYLEQLKKEGLI